MPKTFNLLLGAGMIAIGGVWHFYNSGRREDAYADLENIRGSFDERVSIMCTNRLKRAEQQRRADAKNKLDKCNSEEAQAWSRKRENYRAVVEREKYLVQQEGVKLDRKIQNSISDCIAFREGEIEVGRLGLTKVWIEKKPSGEIQIGFDFNHVTENIVAGVQLFDQFGVCISDIEKRVPAKYEHYKEVAVTTAIAYIARVAERWAEMKGAQGACTNPYFMESESKKSAKPVREEARRVRSAAKEAAIQTTGVIGGVAADYYTRKMGEVISDESGISLFDVEKIDAAKLPVWPPSYMRIYVGVE